MLRNDGLYTIFCIQHYVPEYGKPGAWVGSNLDHFHYPEGFNASGECWQQTGVTGTFDQVEAIAGWKWLREKWPETQFRVVCVTASQHTRVEWPT